MVFNFDMTSGRSGSRTTGQHGRMTTESGRNGNETKRNGNGAGTASEAFARWLHYQQGHIASRHDIYYYIPISHMGLPILVNEYKLQTERDMLGISGRVTCDICDKLSLEI